MSIIESLLKTVGVISDRRQDHTDTAVAKVFPISDLPNEILGIVFLLNATDRKIAIQDRSSATLASSQVCQRWRSLTLQHSALWSPIIDYNHNPFELVQELVRRSGTELIDFGDSENCIRFKFSRHHLVNCNRVLTFILDHAPRLRNFHFDVVDPSWWQAICNRLLRHPAPHLEFFGIDSVKNGRRFAGTLFANQAPLLRGMKIEVDSWIVDFTSPCSFLLTDLHIEVDPPWGSPILLAPPSIRDWLLFLGGMPSLRWITILGISIEVELDFVVTSAPLPTVHLPDLELLCISGPFHQIVTLISHLSMPPQCGLSMKSYYTNLDPGDRSALCAIVKKRLEFWESSTSSLNRFLAVRHVDNYVLVGNQDIGGELWDPSADAESRRGTPFVLNPILTVCLFPEDQSFQAPLFVLLFSLFIPIFPGITDIKLSLDPIELDGHIEQLAPHFEHFHNLNMLSLMKDSHIHLFPILRQPSERTPVLLPTLRLVQFSTGYFPTGSDALLQAAAFFQWRKEKKHPIPKAEMIKCFLDKSFVRSKFRGVKVDMIDTWDQNE